ncbi:MAG: SusC/RagA family TonB-linked outer membrane protein [Prevotellaceae bacterium]|jgi:TonB-linked SusC/RagA family outer membrane protein|nr:SusC/RagA family TonB-linked outer membrane protein [Prevotellaceae bacterium]
MMKNLILSTETLKKVTLMLLLFAGFSVLTFAQTRTITGTVVDDKGEAQMAVSVFVQGTKIGAYTDANGHYTLNNVPEKATLVFSSIGYTTQTVAVGDRSIINVTLAEETTALEEAVVTAEFGLKRVARSIGSSVQNIKAEEITESGRDNFITALQGRVSGMSITNTTGAPGASTSVVLRNFSSISGSNQPLYIIDGVPMNNSTFSPTGFADPIELRTSNLDFASQGNDFNPEDIESMSILKGAAAAALYGSDASNGAIVITTKKGSKGRGKITYSTSLRFDKAYGYPVNQTKYANGAYGTTNFYYLDHFGGRYPENVPIYDNYKALTQTGVTKKHSIAIDGGNDKVTLRLSGTYLDQTGVVKTTDYSRLNLSLSGRAEINKWFEINSSISFAETSNNKAPKGTYGVLYQAMLHPMVGNMLNYLAPDGKHMNYDASPYLDGDFINPLFGLYKNKFYDESNNVMSSFSVTLKPVENSYIIATAGWNITNSTYEAGYHPYYGTYSARGDNGSYNISNGNSSYFSLNAVAGYIYDKIKDIRIQAQFGYSQTEQKSGRLSSGGREFMNVDFMSLQNCSASTIVSKTSNSMRRLQGLFGSVEAHYKDMLFLTVRGRNDWSSTLPLDNNSYFYPAAELSWIVSDLPVLKDNPVLSYLKIKGAIAQVGKDASPYSVYPALLASEYYGGGYRYDWTGPNLTLRPEIQTQYEIGFETRLWKDRINADFTYYKTRCDDQIVNDFRLSYATGYVLHDRNMGTFDNWGWEAHIDADVLRNKDLRWNVSLNVSRAFSKVVALPEGLTEYYDPYTWVVGGARNGVIVGMPLTTLTVIPKKRNKDGKLIISRTTGHPYSNEGVWQVLCDREPKLRFGISTLIKYKQFQLSALLDGRLGATVINGTGRWMWEHGMSEGSVKWREKGSIIFDGVLDDEFVDTDNPTPNNIVVPLGLGSSTMYSGLIEDWIERDVYYLRLQEVRFSYKVPRQWLQKTTKGVLNEATVFVAGNDVVVFTNYTGLDVVGNANSAALGGTGGFGIDNFSIPSPRGITFGLTLTF